MKTMTRGSRIAKITAERNGYNVYVGHSCDPNCPGEEIAPGLWFKGRTTCSQTFKTLRNAEKAANAFLEF